MRGCSVIALPRLWAVVGMLLSTATVGFGAMESASEDAPCNHEDPPPPTWCETVSVSQRGLSKRCQLIDSVNYNVGALRGLHSNLAAACSRDGVSSLS